MTLQKTYIKQVLKVPFALLAILTVLFNACEKETDTVKPTAGDNNVIKLESDGYTPIGVPVVLSNDNFVIAFAKDLINEGAVVFCYNKLGEQVWQTELPETPENPVSHKDQLFFACRNRLYAIDANTGTENWQYQLTNDGMLATKKTYKPCVDSDGNIIVSLDSYLSDIDKAVPGKIVSLSASGVENWVTPINLNDNYYDRFTKLSAPLATSNGIYCIAHISTANGNNAVLSSYNIADGKSIHGIVYDEYNGCHIHCANNNGDIFISGNDDINAETKLIALTATLSEKWNVSFENNYVSSNAIIDKEGNVFIGVEDGYFHKYTPDGQEIFSIDHQRIFVRGEIVIANDGNLYKCLQGPEKIDPNNGQVTNIPFQELGISDLSILSNGTLVFAGMGKIFMAETQANGFSTDAQWPSFGNNGGNNSFKNCK